MLQKVLAATDTDADEEKGVGELSTGRPSSAVGNTLDMLFKNHLVVFQVHEGCDEENFSIIGLCCSIGNMGNMVAI